MAFCRKANWSVASLSSLPATTTPPITSECPLRYFVAECITRLKPCSMRALNVGARKSVICNRDRADGSADLSYVRKIDQLQHRIRGVSIQISFVRGVVASRIRSGSLMST